MTARPETPIPDQTADGQALAGVSCSPVRVTLSRRKGWRMPENTVKVCRPGKWGNPFRIGKYSDCTSPSEYYVANTQADAVRLYTEWLDDGVTHFCPDGPPCISEIRRELAGRNLACWCKEGTPCHADVLLDLANVESIHPESKH